MRAGQAPKPRSPGEPAVVDPVAHVLVDLPLPHLDRPFDYLVPATLADDARPGARVRVRFAGKDVGGFILARRAASEHGGTLTPIRRVVSPEPVLSPEIAALARAVADRYAGTVADVLRLAIPPRHGRAETAARTPDDHSVPRDVEPRGDAFADYESGAAFLAALHAGGSPRAVWSALPGVADGTPRWCTELAAAVHTTVLSDRGAVVVVPDHRDVAALSATLDATIGTSTYVTLTADLGPERRYQRWLAVRRGDVQVAIGTRAAAFAPVRDLGLVAIWDDGDDLHAEPRAPYPHVREILLLRAQAVGTAALVGGYAVTAEGARLVRTGWAERLRPARTTLRGCAPQVRVAGSDTDLARDPAARSARLPSLAWETARDALAVGPVLVQVPRAGYVPALACAACWTRATCQHCGGQLSLLEANTDPRCDLCGRIARDWTCPECGHDALRAPVVGAARTAEELGRAFPKVPVVVSGGDRVRAAVPARPALVIATPGAEPIATDGYAAALLLDGALMLGRADLRAAEETLRRWLAAAALVRSQAPVVVMADPQLRAVQALVRWDPWGFADRELADRRATRFPPEAVTAMLTGDPASVRAALSGLNADVLGPVPVEDPDALEPVVRAIVRCPPRGRAALTTALRTIAAQRSVHKAPGTLRVVVDRV